MRISDWSSDVCSSDLQYETERKDQQIASLGILNREKTRRNNYILAGLLLFLLLSAFLFRQYRVTGKRNQLLTESNEMINRQSQQLQLLMKELNQERQSGGQGKSEQVRVDIGGG